jgi:rubrerythrin
VDQTEVHHPPLEDPTDEEVQVTNEEKLSQRFEAFKEETARMNRAYWASVRRAEARSKEIRASYTPVYECPVCGLLRPADHSKDCKDLRPADLTMEEKIHRNDYPSDYNWDYELTA